MVRSMFTGSQAEAALVMKSWSMSPFSRLPSLETNAIGDSICVATGSVVSQRVLVPIKLGSSLMLGVLQAGSPLPAATPTSPSALKRGEHISKNIIQVWFAVQPRHKCACRSQTHPASRRRVASLPEPRIDWPIGP